ncbi:stage II sporulation protein M [Alicyclobacillus sp. ALC3]|uniref:stage II sporulation protein M n=1 Tax=Alicyclobacillus sp. ALC3 TaxID=2796143 RepID=UPI0023784BCB|nr:stage II sporulation protein M [Alicyclobacillus sp. ALC3]WDL98905.1 stage II sporulation protein M [Alicyclobacillus sp. ALC3]
MNRMEHRLRSRGGLVYWLVAVALLASGFVVGELWPAHFLHLLRPSILHIQHIARTIDRNGNALTAIWTVFWNNTRVALLMMVLGVFAGVFPIFTMWTNGLMMGVVTHVTAAHVHVQGWKVVLFGEMPHGIFELTALTWACALGLRLAVAALQSVWALLGKGGAKGASGGLALARVENETPVANFRQEVRHVIGRIPFILAILWVAACIEILVTPHLIRAFLG